MQELSIRDVPDKLVDGLRLRATRHRRSLQGELMAIIELAVAETDGLGWPFGPSPTREGRQSMRRGWKTIEQIYAENVAMRRLPMRAGTERDGGVELTGRDSQ